MISIKPFLNGMVLIASLIAGTAWAGVHIQHWTTAEGMRVYFVENHQLPMLDISVDFPAGSAYDPAAQSGLAKLTQTMLDQGAAGMSDEAISNKLADVGAALGAHFDRDRSGVTLRTLSSEPQRETAVSVLLDVLQHPDFPQAAFERERARMLAILKEEEARPEAVAGKAFYRAIYGTHPYGQPENGTAEGLTDLKREDLASFYAGHYRASGAVLAMIGDLTSEQARQLASHLSARLPEGQPPAGILAPQPQKPQTIRISLPTEQSHILIGEQGMSRTDPDYFPLYVGNYVLGGGGFDSRLMEEVRQKRGYAYSAYGYFYPLMQPGPLVIGLQTRKEETDNALKVARETVGGFVRKGPTPAELAQAKNNLVRSFPLRIDSNRKILDYLSVIGFYQLPLDYLDTWAKKADTVTLKQVDDAFKRRVKLDELTTVVVGPERE